MLEFGIDLIPVDAPEKVKKLSKKGDGVLWLVIVLICLFITIIESVIIAITWPYAIFSFIANVIFKKGIDKEG
jgi:MFS superfamily sulfate permease-like transporter